MISPRISWSAQPEFDKIFEGKDGCFVLYDVKADRIIMEYENTIVKWDGVDREYVEWNRDQTPKSWLKYSPVWVSQWIMPQLGLPQIEKYLADFRYGNRDMSGGITQAWLSSTLKISAEEQIDFLKRFWLGNISVSKRAIALTKKSMDGEFGSSGATMLGKTGSGYLGDRNDPKGRRVGWYIGHLISGDREFLFATNFRGVADSKPPGYTARNITKRILKDGGLF